MPRRSIFNDPSSDHDPAAEEEGEGEGELPDQPSDLSVSDPGSETEQVPPTDDEEEQFSPDDGEDLPTGPDLETEAEDDSTKDDAAAVSSEDAAADDDDDNDVPYRWGDTIDTRRTVRDFYAVIASLDRDHNSALANHLYSAHLIKRQGLSALASSSSDSSTDTASRKRRHSPTRLADDTLLSRSKRFITNSWTSWPHPPHHVPREAEHNPRGLKSQPRSSHIDAATYEEQVKREPATAADAAPSRMLEEVLTAAFLREGKERLRARGDEAEGLVPVLDAEVSTHMLRPIVRNIISRLDALLVGLYHERTYAKALMKEEEEEEKKAAAAAAQEGPRKRRRASGPKKPQAQRQRTLPKPAVTPMTDTEEEEEQAREDDSQGPSQQQVRRRGRAPPKLAKKWAKKRRTRLRLRDWSNIVGVAALTGFEQEVVQRTAKRCEGGFGQTMEWRRLAHDDHLEGRKSGDEWTGARPEVGREGGGEGERYKGICRDGFMEPVRITPKRNDKRVRSKYKDQN